MRVNSVRLRRAISVFLAAAFLSAAAWAGDNRSTCNKPGYQVASLAKDGSSIDVLKCSNGILSQLIVEDSGLRDRVKTFNPGDFVDVEPSNDGKSLKAISIEYVDVTIDRRFLVLGGSTLFLFILTLILSLFHPLRLIIGEDGRYSNSKFQMFLWFAVLIATYLATIWIRAWDIGADFLGGINIPTNLLLISGLSAFTFGAAKGITTGKVQDAIAAGNLDPKRETNAPNLILDLTHDDGINAVNTPKLDLGDFQMLVITLIAVCTYVALVFHFLGSLEMRKITSLPDVDTTILATFGLGHGAYLTKKAVGEVGKS